MKFSLIAILSIAAMAALGKPSSTHWETNPQPPKYGIAYVCPHCGQVWGNIPPNLKEWERRHLLSEMGKFIALHMRVRHGKQVTTIRKPQKRRQKKG